MSVTTKDAASGGDAPPCSPWRSYAARFEPLLPHAGAVCLLAGLLAIFFWRPSFEHRILSPADWIYVGYPWAADPPKGFVAPQNANQGDDAFLYYPRRYSYYEQTGASWWQDQYVASARNTFSNDFIGLDYYPVSWVYRLLPFPIANGFFHAGILLAAAVSMYLLLWQLKLPWLSRVYGGMLFMLNGHFMVWLGAWILPAMLGLVPLMIFGFERYRETRHRPYLLIPAVCFAIQIYIAYIPAWVVTGGVLGMYGMVRLAPIVWKRDVRRTVATIAGYASAGALGLGLAAYSLVPSIASAVSSTYQQDRLFGLQRAGLENAWTLLFPNYWGTESVAGGLYLAPWGAYPSLTTYFGITAAPLAIIGLWVARRAWTTWFAAAMLAFSLSQIYGIPPLSELAHLPGLKQTAAFRWNFCVPFAVALLAPSGLSALLQHRPDRPERLRLAAAAAAVAIVGVASVIVLSIVHHDSATFRLITEKQGLIPSLSQIDDQVNSLSTHFHRQVGLLIVAGLGLAAALILPVRWWRVTAIALVALTFVDLWGFGSGYNATLERSDLYPTSPGIQFLQQDHSIFRIAQVGSRLDPMPGYTANIFGLQTINGYDHYRDQDYFDFLSPMHSPEDVDDFNGAGYVNIGSNRWPLNESLLSTLNVKYVVTPPTGLYYALAAQSRNESAYPVFDGHREGQAFSLSGSFDAIEFLLGTGGGKPLHGEVIVHLKQSPTSSDVFTWRVDASKIIDNRWLVLNLPEGGAIQASGEMYAEIEAPDQTIDRPLWVWGIRSEGPDGWQHFEDGAPAQGSLTFRVLQSPGDWVKPVYQGDDLDIYEVASALPRVWGAGEAQMMPDRAAVFDRIAQDDFDPAKTVLFENGADAGAPRSPAGVQTQIEHYSPGDVTVHTSGAGWMVFSARYDGGWQASVDGQSAQLLRADGILMAVHVDAGEHTVKLTFDPPEYVWGRRISIASVVLVVLALAAYAAHIVRRRFTA